ncbi:MAG: SH3 domain-containing protein [Oscillospiraceae bacterium]|jgi:GH24 family phage-related lysozyme (muramidase)|nr:SH3 domain-containing protein [Oscillospiraceae bacterium]
MFKRIISTITVFILLFSVAAVSFTASAAPEWTMGWDYALKTGVTKIYSKNGLQQLADSATAAALVGGNSVLIVPATAFSRNMGLDITIDEAAKTVKLSKEGFGVIFTLGSDTAILESASGISSSTFGTLVTYTNNEYYLPLRFTAALFDYRLYYEGDGMVILTTRELLASEISAQIATARFLLTGENYGEQSVTDLEPPKPPEPPIPDNVTTPITKVKTGVVKSTVNLREGASTSTTRLASLPEGEKVFITEVLTDWYKVQTKGWLVGYVSAPYLTSIKDEVTDISMGFEFFLINEKSARQITYKSGASGVSYSSNNTAIATVSSTGVVSGKKAGLATITATYGKEKASYVIVVCKYTWANVINTRSISTNGTKFIATCEGGMSADGLFHKYKDPIGIWTIGYGHVIQPGEVFPEYLTPAEAEALLHKDLNEGSYVKAINNFVKNEGLTLNQNQFDALVSFAFNLGPAYWGKTWNMFYLKAAILAFRVGSDTVPANIYEGFGRYHKAGGKNFVGLYTRRMDEAEMFLIGDYKREYSSKWPRPNDGEVWY